MIYKHTNQRESFLELFLEQVRVARVTVPMGSFTPGANYHELATDGNCTTKVSIDLSVGTDQCLNQFSGVCVVRIGVACGADSMRSLIRPPTIASLPLIATDKPNPP